MATAFVSFHGVNRHACVACMGLLDRVLARCSQEAGSGVRAPVCRKVVRACSQPQGMFLHFETHQSGVGECGLRSHPKPQGGLCAQVPHLRLAAY